MVFENAENFLKKSIGKPLNFILKRVDEPLEKIFWNIFLLVVVTILNWIIMNAETNEENGEEKLSFGDAFYYTITCHFTIGFGDIGPRGSWSRLIYYLHISMVWFINMVPAGLTIFKNLKEKQDFPTQRSLQRQNKFKSVFQLPKKSKSKSSIPRLSRVGPSPKGSNSKISRPSRVEPSPQIPMEL